VLHDEQSQPDKLKRKASKSYKGITAKMQYLEMINLELINKRLLYSNSRIA
jgi:hypothetical protein